MRAALSLAALLASVSSAWSSLEKSLPSRRSGFATVLELTGVDTSKAVVTVRIKRDDVDEESQRDFESCPTSSFYLEAGSHSYVNAESDKSTGAEGEVPASGSPAWTSHSTGKLTGNCGACRMREIEDSYELLCPTAAGPRRPDRGGRTAATGRHRWCGRRLGPARPLHVSRLVEHGSPVDATLRRSSTKRRGKT